LPPHIVSALLADLEDILCLPSLLPWKTPFLARRLYLYGPRTCSTCSFLLSPEPPALARLFPTPPTPLPLFLYFKIHYCRAEDSHPPPLPFYSRQDYFQTPHAGHRPYSNGSPPRRGVTNLPTHGEQLPLPSLCSVEGFSAAECLTRRSRSRCEACALLLQCIWVLSVLFPKILHPS
jgi:hypothetical protein